MSYLIGYQFCSVAVLRCSGMLINFSDIKVYANSPAYVDDTDGLDVCDCAPGYYYDTDSCVLCQENNYCVGGDTSTAVQTSCNSVGANTVSDAGSDSADDCLCNAGYVEG